jgi:hypothetical protein
MIHGIVLLCIVTSSMAPSPCRPTFPLSQSHIRFSNAPLLHSHCPTVQSPVCPLHQRPCSHCPLFHCPIVPLSHCPLSHCPLLRCSLSQRLIATPSHCRIVQVSIVPVLMTVPLSQCPIVPLRQHPLSHCPLARSLLSYCRVARLSHCPLSQWPSVPMPMASFSRCPILTLRLCLIVILLQRASSNLRMVALS